MQISIDTSRDSKEDILKAINLLHSIIGEHPTTTKNLFDAPQPTVESQGSVFGALFDSMDKTVAQPTVAKPSPQPRVELY